MSKLTKTPSFDKDLLVMKIVEQFRNANTLFYKRALLEFFDSQGQFIGDNLFETTFKLRKNLAPLIYEVSGPYDTVSKEYATVAKVYHRGEMKYQFDLKSGIFQRTAAMVWIYLNAFKHIPKKVLLIGAGKVGRHTAEYLKHFNPGLQMVDYQDLAPQIPGFEAPLKEVGLQTRYEETPDLSSYDTIIMATTTNQCLIHAGNITLIKPGTMVVSLCTSSQSGEISSEIFAQKDVNIFLDYELTKTFTADMKNVNDLGYLDRAICYREVLQGKDLPDLGSRINLIRLTGTPIQNVAVIDIMLGMDSITI